MAQDPKGRARRVRGSQWEELLGATEQIRSQMTADAYRPPLMRPAAPGDTGFERPMREGVRADADRQGRRKPFLGGARTARDTAAAYGDMYHISPEATTNIQRLASRHGIPAEYAYGLVDVESSFKQSKRSGVGAVGLAQVRPEYAGKEVGTPRDVLERSPVDNLDAGFEYLRRQKERFGTWERALDAYNRGPTAARRRPSRGYARKVMGEG